MMYIKVVFFEDNAMFDKQMFLYSVHIQETLVIKVALKIWCPYANVDTVAGSHVINDRLVSFASLATKAATARIMTQHC